MITPAQAARLQRGDTILARSTHHTAEAYGQAWVDNGGFQRVRFIRLCDDGGVEVNRYDQHWAMSPLDCKIIKRGRNKWKAVVEFLNGRTWA